MTADHYLVLALTDGGWGETALGIRVAEDLATGGEASLTFLTHATNKMALVGTPFAQESVSEGSAKLLRLYVDTIMRSETTAAIILADMVTTQRFCAQHGVASEFLGQYGVPVLGIDTWDHTVTGPTLDLFLGDSQDLDLSLAKISRPLLPAPILSSSPRAGAYSCLPKPIHVPRRVRTHLRDNLGLGDSERLILLSTAPWQHRRFSSPHGNRLAAALPLLLSEYIARLGPSVHLAHVGPSPYPLAEQLGDRYHWLPPLIPLHFDELLGSADLLVSANISASTNLKAIASGIPTVVVHNSREARELGDLEPFLDAPSEALSRWLAQTLPIYPFRLWPLGWFRFLSPVLQDNHYFDAVAAVELLDERGFEEACRSLLFDRSAQQRSAEQQAGYVRELARLPRARDVVRKYIEGGAG